MNRSDQQQLRHVLQGLEVGATLVRPPHLRDFYVDRGAGDLGGGRLSPEAVQELEDDGTILRCGKSRYALASGSNSLSALRIAGVMDVRPRDKNGRLRRASVAA